MWTENLRSFFSIIGWRQTQLSPVYRSPRLHWAENRCPNVLHRLLPKKARKNATMFKFAFVFVPTTLKKRKRMQPTVLQQFRTQYVFDLLSAYRHISGIRFLIIFSPRTHPQEVKLRKKNSNGVPLPDKLYTFDEVFSTLSTQEEVFRRAIDPLVEEVLNGFNCTVFACTYHTLYSCVTRKYFLRVSLR